MFYILLKEAPNTRIFRFIYFSKYFFLGFSVSSLLIDSRTKVRGNCHDPYDWSSLWSIKQLPAVWGQFQFTLAKVLLMFTYDWNLFTCRFINTTTCILLDFTQFSIIFKWFSRWFFSLFLSIIFISMAILTPQNHCRNLHHYLPLCLCFCLYSISVFVSIYFISSIYIYIYYYMEMW